MVKSSAMAVSWDPWFLTVDLSTGCLGFLTAWLLGFKHGFPENKAKVKDIFMT